MCSVGVHSTLSLPLVARASMVGIYVKRIAWGSVWVGIRIIVEN